jgi:putative membrane protein
MSRFTQNLILLLVGASMAVMLLRGTYVHYVKPALLPWLVIAAVVLIGLGLAAVVRDVRNAGRPDGHQDDEHGHGHRHRGGLVWLLLVPIAMVAFIVPPPLDARGATAAPPVTSAPKPRDFPPLPAGPAPTVAVPEIVMRAAADPARSLDGRTITATGFTLRYPDGVYLGRVVIVCCAADAQLARIRLSGPAAATAAAFGEETWIAVEGKVEPGSAQAANDYVPTMSAATVTRIDEPANTYAY